MCDRPEAVDLPLELVRDLGGRVKPQIACQQPNHGHPGREGDLDPEGGHSNQRTVHDPKVVCDRF
jgi:hypothetical protein